MMRAYRVGRPTSGQSLASLFLLGCLPGGTVQKWAEAAGDHSDPLCKKLAKTGDVGAHRENCQRRRMLLRVLQLLNEARHHLRKSGPGIQGDRRTIRIQSPVRTRVSVGWNAEA